MLFAAVIISSSIVVIAMSITMIIVTAISSSTTTSNGTSAALPVAAPSSERFALDYVLGGQRIGVIVDIGMCSPEVLRSKNGISSNGSGREA
jgi:hypothetical protein